MPTIQDGDVTRKLLKSIPRVRLEAILRVYHHINKVKKQKTTELHNGVKVKTPSGSREIIGASLPLYAATQYIEIMKHLYALQKTKYLKREFVREIGWEIDQKILTSRKTLSQLRTMKIYHGRGRGRDDAFNTLLYLLVLHTTYYIKRPCYGDLKEFLDEQHIKTEVRHTYSTLRKYFKRIDTEDLREKYIYIYNSSVMKKEKDGSIYFFRLPLPSWESLSRPPQQLSHEPGFDE